MRAGSWIEPDILPAATRRPTRPQLVLRGTVKCSVLSACFAFTTPKRKVKTLVLFSSPCPKTVSGNAVRPVRAVDSLQLCPSIVLNPLDRDHHHHQRHPATHPRLETRQSTPVRKGSDLAAVAVAITLSAPRGLHCMVVVVLRRCQECFLQ